MKYLKSSQFVPGKGVAYMLYEVEGEDSIVRMLTYIPQSGEITRYPRPRIKKLFRPELLEITTQEEFEKLWNSSSS